MLKEELIKELKGTNKMTNKHLAKRIGTVEENNIQEQERINEKCYFLLLSLLDKDSKNMVVTLDAIAKLLSQRITNDSPWEFTPHYDFYKDDYITGDRYTVVRNDNGYEPFDEGNPKKEIEEDFIIIYQSVLDMISTNLQEKELFLTNGYQTAEESDKPLADLLIEYLNLKKVERIKINTK